VTVFKQSLRGDFKKKDSLPLWKTWEKARKNGWKREIQGNRIAYGGETEGISGGSCKKSGGF
jgi:hypothetical protein